MDKATLYPELAEIAARASYKQIFDLFYTIAQIRYATQEQLQPLNHRLATKNLLVRMTELGYLSSDNLVKAYHITEKTRELLEREGYNTKVLQKDFTGVKLQHALAITDVILKLQAEPDFYQVFYPIFREPPEYRMEFLRPDFCLIRRGEGKYKIEFGEVETKKENWENYLQVKRDKYEAIARDSNTYAMWWKVWSERLNLPFCDERSFCFSIICFGDIKKDWRGWEFG